MIKQIGFQLNMRIEHGYQTVVPYFDFFENWGKWSSKYFVFQIVQTKLELKKQRNMCI